MSYESWIAFSIAYLLITLSPGPNVVLVLKNRIQFGLQAAILSVLGNLSCQLIIVFLVAIGIGELLVKLPFWFTVFKIIGGAYLIYLGCKSLMSARKDSANKSKTIFAQRDQHHLNVHAKNKTQASAYKQGFLISASNPKTIIFLSAFLPQFLNTTEPHAQQFMMMYATICTIVMAVHMAYAASVVRLGKRLFVDGIESRLNKITGGLFIAMGGGVLISSKA